MKRVFRYVLACFLILASAVPAVSAEKVLLTSGEWPPFYSQSLPHGGVANRVIVESFELVGIEVEFSFEPWMRALESAQHGPAVGSAGWLKTPEREKAFIYSDPVFYSERVFFRRWDTRFDWQTLEDVKDMRIAVTLGSAEEFPLQEVLATGAGKVDIAQSYASGMRKLAANRVDLYACNLEVGLYVLKNHIPPEESALITYHPRPIFEESNHLIISRRVVGAEEIILKFNEGLRQLKESGQYVRSYYDPLGREPVE